MLLIDREIKQQPGGGITLHATVRYFINNGGAMIKIPIPFHTEWMIKAGVVFRSRSARNGIIQCFSSTRGSARPWVWSNLCF